ncbi:hypothetical protein A3H10_04435 [Candidatus Uhrbacteria bacterium RIFCSPLOWO2_12_FULL_46_10]|uniref:Dephospho-CoA kinase n=1 Tax=Candidatus Uhrbacteria bacterium RIFCSPLOWO2_01_FULL_47_25 TaxID=1802402 RepID=A0A1F7URK6_9BACT|nr:MAG: hypothetical protein UX68_C0015G0019 [Parcubacteria group bacterium GW2011_GWA2_46_9]OGL59882.1 MAG: hypothetical protein A2752_04025 [Candidatus Uhrbacteria bacterium RIFCSPHIGHO2_01_FULL_46_23]OGL69433.1 MAG: hypothetical protein A3D60_03095 [Candidatus Uhrbacteria bacterium RIFCSPHIGHO2_02_FULL_47_29]OGL75345.1 MAG: hypothetical protein A3E96_02415 [Candidatus Uhrbacteria bacterium RIFCSPHIGHO2_12_FULL_46_13]OGL80889.1 MAG: hypothetical protein A2936_05660 [Candidatus Uhrbacteria bac
MVKTRRQQIIIGLVGPKGSGKGTVARYLQRRYGASIISCPDILSKVLSMLGIDHTRMNQIKLVQTLRATFGQDVMGRAVAMAIAKLPRSAQRLVVIDNIRPRADWAPWRGKRNATLVAITADVRRRYERLRKRGKTAEEHALSYARFLREERLPTETRTIIKTSREARFTIDGNAVLKDVYNQVDAIAKWLKLKARE